MKKKLAAIAFAGASLAMFAGAPSAGAAHCTNDDPKTTEVNEATTPGYSYFGTVHVDKADHPEGQGVHNGTSGASSCRSADAGMDTSPADRAPGQNK